jgi:hypothetical protein
MTTCPVCEHQQAFGFECEVCGKELGGLSDLGAPPAREERLEGLEPNAAGVVPDLPIEPLSELEVTRFGAVAVGSERVADLEVNQLESVGEVTVEAVPELSRDRTEDDGVRTSVSSGSVTCRYCRQVQAPGALCVTCGMSLPRVPPAPGGPVVVGVAEAVSVRCRQCGAAGRGGERCGECGGALPLP